MRFLTSYGVALLVLILIAGWLATGTLIEGGKGPGNGEKPLTSLFSEPETTVPEPTEPKVAEIEPAALQSVRYVTFTAEQMPLEVPLRGRTKANATVSVRPETTGTVAAVHVVKGQKANPGDLLCTLDSGTRKTRVAQATASLAQAEAALQQAEADFETNKSLRAKGLEPSNTARNFKVALSVAVSGKSAALASLDDAQAELARVEIRTEIKGVVQDPLANVGDMLSAGGVCATIVQLDPMLFVGKVPEAKIGLVQKGMSADIVTVTGQMVSGEVAFVASTADEATRSFSIEIAVDNADYSIRDGITASATINIGSTQAHLIPQSVLTLDGTGTIGVRAVEDNRAKFHPVTLLRDTPQGVWVAGLPTSVNAIVLGQEYVVDGQKVAASQAEQEASS